LEVPVRKYCDIGSGRYSGQRVKFGVVSC
jgi:hypothetical protein